MALEKAIEGHHAAPEIKADARSKLKALLEHRLVVRFSEGLLAA
jgi:hypothetical protein